MKTTAYLLPLLFLVLAVSLASCDPDTEFRTGESVDLRFSTDTLTFDTVFTARGSATRMFKVYNDGAEPIMIDRISVDGTTGVEYTFNVDGFQGPEAEDVVIWGEDSIFVFVEVEVDPTEPTEVSPFVAEDLLVFETGNREQNVVLTAFGQNAEYLFDFARGQAFLFSCDNGTVTLPNDLPVVIYGSLVIDSCILQVMAGTEIYFHGGVQRNQALVGGNGFFNDGFIFTQPDGSVQFLGTRENPIILRTDRLEEEFAEEPAKYRGLILGAGSRNNILEHTVMTNAIVGITIDSAAEVTIDNSIIAYSGGPAISAYESDVTVTNSVFHSNFGNAVQFVKGGSLTMRYVTIANYGVDASSLVLTNFDCDENGQNCVAAPMTANLDNCIISGSRPSELIFFDIFAGDEPGLFEINIDNSVVRTDNAFLQTQDGLFADFYGGICNGCVNLAFDDPLFRDLNEDDYTLDSLSVARGIGFPIPGVGEDILGVARDGMMPDAGAYEGGE